MGFIGGYVTPIIGIDEEDKKDVYYVIDEIRFNSDISTNDTVNINITFNSCFLYLTFIQNIRIYIKFEFILTY